MLKYQAIVESRTIKTCHPTQETETHLLFNDWPMPKHKEGYCFFDTFEEAKAYLILEVEGKKHWHYQQIDAIDRQVSKLKQLTK